ncbi:MAG: hypothetical protein WDO19_28655 [Bacteroidota bacterium]
MKGFLSGSVIILLVVLSFFQAGFTSCTKDTTIYDTVTVNRTDTIILKDTVLTADILTAHPWKIQEIRGVVDNGWIMYYLRGGTTNTESFDNEYIVFNADQTGYEIDNIAINHPITHWEFSNAEHSKVIFTYTNVPNTTSTINWENIHYKNKSIYCDEYYTNNNTGDSFHGQKILIAK